MKKSLSLALSFIPYPLKLSPPLQFLVLCFRFFLRLAPEPNCNDVGLECQSAFKFDPASASNFDPFERRVLTVAVVSSELAGVAEMRRPRVR